MHVLGTFLQSLEGKKRIILPRFYVRQDSNGKLLIGETSLNLGLINTVENQNVACVKPEAKAIMAKVNTLAKNKRTNLHSDKVPRCQNSGPPVVKQSSQGQSSSCRIKPKVGSAILPPAPDRLKSALENHKEQFRGD